MKGTVSGIFSSMLEYIKTINASGQIRLVTNQKHFDLVVGLLKKREGGGF